MSRRVPYFRVMPLVLLAAAALQGQEPKSFPCRFIDYRIKDKNTALFLCGASNMEKGKWGVEIVALNGDGERIAGTSRQATLKNADDSWLELTFDTPDGSFQSKTSYRLITEAEYHSVKYEPAKYEFDTTPEATFLLPPGARDKAGEVRLIFRSKVALNKESLATVVVTEDRPVAAQDNMAVKPGEKSAPVRFVPIAEQQTGSDQIGEATVYLADEDIRSLNTHLSVKGVKNILGAEVLVPAKSRLKFPGAPKDKDSSDFYVRLLGQSGKGKPGWAADVKFAPEVANLGHGYFLQPSVLADVGWGTVKDTSPTNMIKAGLGVTKYMASNSGALRGARITPQLSFETDRTGKHQNMLFDGDIQFFGKGWRNTIQTKNEQKFAAAADNAVKAGKKAPDPDSIEKATTGWQFQAFLGTEIGGRLSSDTVKSSDKATSVMLPTYTIARLRPKLTLLKEINRFSLTLAVTPRVLIEGEKVTREQLIADPKDATKNVSQIYVKEAKGLRAYGEAGVSWQFDTEGHYALSVIYKVGSMPPNFDFVSTVQTGITVKF